MNLQNVPPAVCSPGGSKLDVKFYLFGGLSVLSAGWEIRLMNDFWVYDPQTVQWTQLEPDDGRVLNHPTQVDGKRPSAVAAMEAAVIGQTIYFQAGWGGYSGKVVLSPQLWAYHVGRQQWELLGDGRVDASEWPAKRYCSHVTSWQGKLYQWAGRDTQDRSPQFYNDLWVFDPQKSRWERLMPNLDIGPSARYAAGEARVGPSWYIFGGFGNEAGNAPQLNDLWRLDLRTGVWKLIEPDDGSKDVSPQATRPSVRRVPATTAAGDSVYIFAGLDLASGPEHTDPLIAFNDLWQGTAVPS